MRRLAEYVVILSLIPVQAGSQTVTTVAGTGTYGYSGDNGAAASAQIDTAYGVAADAQGDVFVADTRNHRVRKISDGLITTVAGNGQAGFSGDGAAAVAAQLNFPRGVAVDGQGNLYIADTGNCRVRKVTQAGIISTVAGTGTAGFAGDGGAAASAQLSYPEALAVDSAGNLYVADSWNYRVREIATNGKIQTIAGNGSYGPFGDGGLATAASLGLIQSLTLDAGGNLYLSDGYNHRVRRVVPGGSISTVIGGGFGPAVDGGPAASAALKFPKGVAVDGHGNLFVADSLNQRIRVVSSAGVIGTIAGAGTAGYSGDGGPAVAAQLNGPSGLAMGPGGALTVSDLWNYRVRGLTEVVPAVSSVSNAAGGQLGIAPGAYVTILGTGLAPKTDTWSNSIVNQQLPTQLDGVTASVGGNAAYVEYISPSQINVLAPNVSAGAVQVQVTNSGIASAPFSSTVQPDSPAFFPWGQYAVATHLDYSLCGKPGMFSGATTTPAQPGEWITLWGTGFGPAGAPPGVATPGGQVYLTTPVTATLGGENAPVYGGAAVLTAGEAGLYQVTIQIPADAANGDAQVRATVGGMQSPAGVFLTVQH